MARIEAELGIASTYMVIPDSPLYTITGERESRRLREMVALGHEVALHFDIHRTGLTGEEPMERFEQPIRQACRAIADITGIQVSSISFHRPVAAFIRSRDRILGLVNAYGEGLMGSYLSDSKGRWRSGEPLSWLLNQDETIRVTQVLVHPIWWDEEHLPPWQRLDAFVREMTQSMDEGGRGFFARELADTLPGVGWIPV